MPRPTPDPAPPPRPVTPSWLLPGLGLALLVVVAYLPLWSGGFIWDDDLLVTDNPAVRGGLDGLVRIWRGETTDYYPLTWTLFWLEWHAWGACAPAFHVVNVTLHVVAALLVWRLLLHLEMPVAWLGAALFALQPANVSSVAWISEGKNTLSLVFAAATTIVYLRWRDGGRGYGLALLLYTAALLSKSSVVTLPAVLLALTWWKRGRFDGRDVRAIVPFLVLATAAGVGLTWFQAHRVLGGEVVRPEGLASRLAASGWILWHYLRVDLLPIDLPIIYPRWNVEAGSLIAWIPVLVWIGLLAVLLGKRVAWGRGPLAAALCWTFLLAPVLGFVPLSYMKYALVTDHWQYLATVVSMACVAWAVSRLENAKPGTGPRRAVPALGGVLVAAFAGLTVRQATVYATSEPLWRAAVARNPAAWVAWHNLGQTLDLAGRADEAEGCYETCLRLQPDMALAHINLGVIRRKQGHVDEAIAHYEAALETRPNNVVAHYNLAIALQAQGRIDAAVAHLERAVEIEPDRVEAHANLAAALIMTGRPIKAEAHARRALQARPDDPLVMYNLGLALERQGQLEGALEPLERAWRLRPDLLPASVRIAWIRATAATDALRDGPRARTLAAAACEANPADVDAWDALAAAEAECGRFGAAVTAARRAASLARGEQQTEIERRMHLYDGLEPYRTPHR